VRRTAKPIEFWGGSLEELRSFPATARREAGYQLHLVQEGEDPDDWKPMTTVGPGVREIRIRDRHGIFRVMYVANFEDAVYVLNCFQKKTQKTAAANLATAERRYRELVEEKKR
jgi:phage-related protein